MPLSFIGQSLWKLRVLTYYSYLRFSLVLHTFLGGWGDALSRWLLPEAVSRLTVQQCSKLSARLSARKFLTLSQNALPPASFYESYLLLSEDANLRKELETGQRSVAHFLALNDVQKDNYEIPLLQRYLSQEEILALHKRVALGPYAEANCQSAVLRQRVAEGFLSLQAMLDLAPHQKELLENRALQQYIDHCGLFTDVLTLQHTLSAEDSAFIVAPVVQKHLHSKNLSLASALTMSATHRQLLQNATLQASLEAGLLSMEDFLQTPIMMTETQFNALAHDDMQSLMSPLSIGEMLALNSSEIERLLHKTIQGYVHRGDSALKDILHLPEHVFEVLCEPKVFEAIGDNALEIADIIKAEYLCARNLKNPYVQEAIAGGELSLFEALSLSIDAPFEMQKALFESPVFEKLCAHYTIASLLTFTQKEVLFILHPFIQDYIQQGFLDITHAQALTVTQHAMLQNPQVHAFIMAEKVTMDTLLTLEYDNSKVLSFSTIQALIADEGLTVARALSLNISLENEILDALMQEEMKAFLLERTSLEAILEWDDVQAQTLLSPNIQAAIRKGFLDLPKALTLTEEEREILAGEGLQYALARKWIDVEDALEDNGRKALLLEKTWIRACLDLDILAVDDVWQLTDVQVENLANEGLWHSLSVPDILTLQHRVEKDHLTEEKRAILTSPGAIKYLDINAILFDTIPFSHDRLESIALLNQSYVAKYLDNHFLTVNDVFALGPEKCQALDGCYVQEAIDTARINKESLCVLLNAFSCYFRRYEDIILKHAPFLMKHLDAGLEDEQNTLLIETLLQIETGMFSELQDDFLSALDNPMWPLSTTEYLTTLFHEQCEGDSSEQGLAVASAREASSGAEARSDGMTVDQRKKLQHPLVKQYLSSGLLSAEEALLLDNRDLIWLTRVSVQQFFEKGLLPLSLIKREAMFLYKLAFVPFQQERMMYQEETQEEQMRRVEQYLISKKTSFMAHARWVSLLEQENAMDAIDFLEASHSLLSHLAHPLVQGYIKKGLLTLADIDHLGRESKKTMPLFKSFQGWHLFCEDPAFTLQRREGSKEEKAANLQNLAIVLCLCEGWLSLEQAHALSDLHRCFLGYLYENACLEKMLQFKTIDADTFCASTLSSEPMDTSIFLVVLKKITLEDWQNLSFYKRHLMSAYNEFFLEGKIATEPFLKAEDSALEEVFQDHALEMVRLSYLSFEQALQVPQTLWFMLQKPEALNGFCALFERGYLSAEQFLALNVVGFNRLYALMSDLLKGSVDVDTVLVMSDKDFHDIIEGRVKVELLAKKQTAVGVTEARPVTRRARP